MNSRTSSSFGLATLRDFTLRRYRALQRLTHHPTVYSELLRHSLYRSYSVLVLATDLLEQFALSHPFSTDPPLRVLPRLRVSVSMGWAKSNERNGPIPTSEHTRIAERTASLEIRLKL